MGPLDDKNILLFVLMGPSNPDGLINICLWSNGPNHTNNNICLWSNGPIHTNKGYCVLDISDFFH